MKMTVFAVALLLAGSVAPVHSHDGDKDRPKSVLLVYKTTDDGTRGTLQWAIEQSNLNPGKFKIVIDPPGRGPHVIKPNSLLPTIKGPAVIEAVNHGDGKQDRLDAHDVALAGSLAKNPPEVVLDASNFIPLDDIQACPGAAGGFGANVRTQSNPGLAVVDSSDVEISGLEIRGYCIGILIWRSSDNYIHDNWLVDSFGGAGMMITSDDGTGGNVPGLTDNNRVIANVFIDNTDGMELTRAARFSVVADNFFTITRQLPENGNAIEFVNPSVDNMILRNVFTRQTATAVTASATGNIIRGNKFIDNAARAISF